MLQIESKYTAWAAAWECKPTRATRNFPWPGASNIRVPIVRMHADTFAARVMMFMFGTQPLVEVQGWPKELSDPFEKWINWKAINQWQLFDVANQKMTIGQKSGTAVTKVCWLEEYDIDVNASADGADYTETDLDLSGVKIRPCPFEDFYVYPIEAVHDSDIIVRFNRVRYTPEIAEYNCQTGRWEWPWELDPNNLEKRPLKGCLKSISIPKQEKEQQQAGVGDSEATHLELVETYLRYPIGDDPARYYSIVVLWSPDLNDFIDCYFNPAPRNMRTFSVYRPCPREGLFFGDSWVDMLQQFQEEVTTIHNDRRDNSKLANTVTLKVKEKSGFLDQLIYPGKQIVCQDMDDIQPLEFGRPHMETISEELHTLGLAERLTGINSAMQGSAAGATGKRGVYSAQGTMAILSETNDRQGLGIRLFRNALGECLKFATILQTTYQPNDPALEFFQEKDREAIAAAIKYMRSSETRLHMTPFEIRTSTAAANREIERQNLFQVMGVFERWYGQATQMATQLLNPQLNPGLREIYIQTLRSMQALAHRIMAAFEENEPEKILPDYAALVGGTEQQEMARDLNAGTPAEGAGPFEAGRLADFAGTVGRATSSSGNLPS